MVDPFLRSQARTTLCLGLPPKFEVSLTAFTPITTGDVLVNPIRA
jgi:hypothetical protein